MLKTWVSGISLPETYAPETIDKMYRSLSVPEETIRSVRRYFSAASHLYGIISLKHLLHIYNLQNQPISQKDFLAVADIICHEANDFCVLEMGALYEDCLMEDPLEREIVSLLVLSFGLDKYYELVELQRGKPYTVLPKEQFLSYLNPGYYPATPENLNVLMYLRTHKSCLQGAARDMLQSIQCMIWVGCGVQETIRCLTTTGFRFQNHADRRVFKVLFHAMERHTRTIANRGQTPAATGGHRSLCLSGHRRWTAGFMSAARGYIFR